MNKTHAPRLYQGILFVAAVIMVQITPIYVILIWALLLIGAINRVPANLKSIIVITLLYITGYWTAFYMEQGILYFIQSSREIEVIASRFSLVGYILPFFIYYIMKKSETNYFKIGHFKRHIYFPLIWKGKKDPIWRFLLIFLGIVTLSFSFFIDFNREDLYTALLFGLMFAVVNSVFEELLWRGFILSRLVDALGEKQGLIISGLGFGFYHYSIGFPWVICLLFSVFGVIMGGVTIKSGGLLPVILMHIVMNILFALSGMIF